MFKERIDKRQDFKPITITLNSKNIQLNNWDELQNLMQTTVDQELALRAQGKKSSLINDLKAAILTAELKQTEDFRSSIFASPQQSKQGEIVGEGTSLDWPAYDLNSLKKGKVVDEGTKLEVPAYDLTSLKKGVVVDEGAQLELPDYDLNSLKKGEAVGGGTKLDLPAYDLNALKKGEAVGEGTKLDLPVYDVASLKKNEIVSEDASSNLPSLQINDSKNAQESAAEKLSAQDDDSATKLDVTENEQKDQLKGNVPSSTLSSLNVKISEKKIEISSNNRSPEINNYKHIISRIKNHKLTKSVKLNAKIKNHHVFSNFKNNVSLPQAGSKNDNIFLLLAGIISLFTALGLSIFKKKK